MSLALCAFVKLKPVTGTQHCSIQFLGKEEDVLADSWEWLLPTWYPAPGDSLGCWFSWDLLQMRSWRAAGRWWPQWTLGNKRYCSVLVRNHETARAVLSSCWAAFHTEGSCTQGPGYWGHISCSSLLWDKPYILRKVQHSVYEIKLLKPSCGFILFIWDQAFASPVYWWNIFSCH